MQEYKLIWVDQPEWQTFAFEKQINIAADQGFRFIQFHPVYVDGKVILAAMMERDRAESSP